MTLLKQLTIGMVLTISATLLTGCGDEKKQTQKVTAIPVQTTQVASSSQPYWVDVFGQTEGTRAVLIYPQVTGPIIERNYAEGSRVKKGDVLFTIDPAPFEAAYQSARAATAQAEVNLEKAEREAKRYTELNKAKAVSQKEYTDAVSELKACQANLDAARAQEREAKITLDYTQVRTPVDGIAGRALINPGALVQAHSTQLTDVTQKRELKVRFSVSEHELRHYRVTADSPVELVGEKFEKPVKAKINFTSIQVDPTTGTRSISADLQSSKGVFPGQFVTVRLTLGEQHNVFLVPQNAIRQLPDGTYSVYLYKDGVARSQPVSVGQWVGTNWIVTSGLKNGDEVIITNIQKLKDRASVTKDKDIQAASDAPASKS